MARTGRPTIFTPELGAAICRAIAAGSSLRRLCQREYMPNRDTVLAWLFDGKHEDFSGQYAQALATRAHGYAEEIVDIADGAEATVATDDEGSKVVVAPDPQRDRLRVDARKWVVSKLLPKVYGEKVALEGGLDIKVAHAPATVEEAQKLLRAVGANV